MCRNNCKHKCNCEPDITIINNDGDGESAYQIAVRTGQFSGTEEEFIDWLHGPEGPQGETGPQGPQGIPGQNGQGLPSGGVTDDILVKNSNTPYDNTYKSLDTLLGLIPLTLVTPVITVAWLIYKTNGVTPYNPNSSSAKNIIVDKGCKVKINAVYQYPNPDNITTKGPTSISGSFGTTDPGPNTFSPPFTNGGVDIDSNNTYNVNLISPKAGLMVTGSPVVNGSPVVRASGNDTKSDSISVTFLGKGSLVYSTMTVLPAGDIENLLATSGNTAFQSNKARTFTGITSGVSNYTYYIYDASLGAITNAIQNGALPVFGAFTRLSDVIITNDAGISINMIVYRSNALNAFSNVTLAFS